MRLSAKCRCGIRILIDLAEYYDQGPEQIGNISKRQNISVKYLEQVIRPLKKANLVESTRGPKGGHMLAKSPHEVTLGKVARTLNFQGEADQCYCNEDKCSSVETCRLRETWQQAYNVFYEELDQTTIAELMGECCI